MNFTPIIDLSDIFPDGLDETEIFVGLVDHGLFCEKLPPCFTSLNLTSALPSSFLTALDGTNEKRIKKSIGEHTHDFIRYEALRDINIPRNLGIPHPASHAIQALAIKNHWSEVSFHTDMPDPKISRIFVRHVGGGRIFEMNYKGEERFDNEEEKIRSAAGAQYLVKADISACFPSIYSHSIPWALHGKAASKKCHSLTKLSGNMLDACTRATRDAQTNGLLIGPHASNIISEIVLTTVDEALLKKGYKRLCRFIDDYEFYAETHEEAERFLRDLGLELREFEPSLNERKTQIVKLPRPSVENWVAELNRYQFPAGDQTRYASVRSFLDFALDLSQRSGTSAPLNYAIKMIPENLNARAKRLFVAEAINLALAYPYLAPVLEPHVFKRFLHSELTEDIEEFASKLCRKGLESLYPDAVAHSLYFALRYKIEIDPKPFPLEEILKLDDCICTVLLRRYASKVGDKLLIAKIAKRASSLKSVDRRDQDRQWLLIYDVWTEPTLRKCGQGFLAELKAKKFRFVEKF